MSAFTFLPAVKAERHFHAGIWPRSSEKGSVGQEGRFPALTSSLLTSLFLMAFCAAALVAMRSPSAASRSFCCCSSLSGLAAAPCECKNTSAVKRADDRPSRPPTYEGMGPFLQLTEEKLTLCERALSKREECSTSKIPTHLQEP